MSDTFKPTHILLKDFRVFEHLGFKEVYLKGTHVFIPKRHRKHFGFCCNVFMLDKKGRVRSNKDKAMAIFSKDFFMPLKDWFAPYKDQL